MPLRRQKGGADWGWDWPMEELGLGLLERPCGLVGNAFSRTYPVGCLGFEDPPPLHPCSATLSESLTSSNVDVLTCEVAHGMWGLRVQAGSLLPLSSRMRAVRAFTSLCLPQCPHLSSWES